MTPIVQTGRQWIRRVGRLLRQNPFAIPGTTRRIQRALWFFWLDGLLVSTSVSLVSSYLVLYALEFGATSSQIGLMSTIIGIASMMALLPGAQLADQWLDPKRAVLIFSRGIGQLVWLALGSLPFFLAGQPAVVGVLALRATRAFTMQASNPAWTVLSGQIVPRWLRGKYFAARNIAKQVAALLVVPAAGWLIDRLGFPSGYQICFGLATVVGIGAFWAYSRIPFEPTRRDEQASEPAQVAETEPGVEDRRSFWTFCATSTCWTFSVQIAAPFFSVYLVQELGATAGIVGILAAVQSLTALPGQALYGRWLDRRGIKWTFALSGLLIPFLIWSWMLVHGPWGVLPIRIAGGFLFAGYNLSNFNMLLAVTPRMQRTRHIAIYRTITQSAVAVAPLLGGLIVDRFGFLPIFAISGVGRLTSVLLLIRFVREPQRQREPGNGRLAHAKESSVPTMQIDYLANHPDAIPTLARWHHDQWKHLNPGDSVEQRIIRLQDHLNKAQIPTTFVALSPLAERLAQTHDPGSPIEPGGLLGSASLIAHDMDTHPNLSPWLASVFVAPQHRRRGIGTALVRRVIQEAKTLGVPNLYLFTTLDKHGFYARLGWKLIEHTNYRGYPQIVMALQTNRPQG